MDLHLISFFYVVNNELHIKMGRNATTSQCGNYGNLLSLFFGKNFVKVKFLQKKLLIVDLTNFFLVSHIALWKNENSLRISLSLKKSRQINSLVISFSKTIAFTKFLRKKCEREFLQFPQLCTLWKLRKFSLPLF